MRQAIDDEDVADEVVGILVFGRVTRGEADRQSDIDLFVIVESDRRGARSVLVSGSSRRISNLRSVNSGRKRRARLLIARKCEPRKFERSEQCLIRRQNTTSEVSDNDPTDQPSSPLDSSPITLRTENERCRLGRRGM
nr:nucleotidyltransferase domain-containing protein [Natrinema gelatinilyticum]